MTSLTTLAGCPLLALPDASVRDVLSWCHDDASAKAFLASCRTLHRLRLDPCAAALTLLRRQRRLRPACERTAYLTSMAALTSCAACSIRPSALVRQALQLLRGGADAGGRQDAPQPLLLALLHCACRVGDAPAVRALLKLPQPPNLHLPVEWRRAIRVTLTIHLRRLGLDLSKGTASGDSHGGAVWEALAGGPHESVLRALLPKDAPIADSCFFHAARWPERLPAFLLMLHHTGPSPRRRDDVSAALRCAARWYDDVETAAALLSYVDADTDTLSAARTASHAGSLDVLELLLRWRPLGVGQLNQCLRCAASAGQAACAEVLLRIGAEVNHGASNGNVETGEGAALLLAVRRDAHCSCWRASHPYVEAAARRATVTVLLRHGAVVTPDALEAALNRDDADVVVLLMAAATRVADGLLQALDTKAAAEDQILDLPLLCGPQAEAVLTC